MNRIVKLKSIQIIKFLLTFACVLALVSCGAKPAVKDAERTGKLTQLKVASYNVEVSKNGTAIEIADVLKPFDFDIICFSEAPGGRWTQDVANRLGLKYVVVGKFSTAGQEDKYKSIVSRTPLYGYEEVLMADTLHTATKASTKIGDREVSIYSVHFPFGWRDQAHIDETTGKVRAFVNYLEEKSGSETSLIMGDFNFIPDIPEHGGAYYDMFVKIGLDTSWKDLRIDITRHKTHNAYKPDSEELGKVIDHIMYDPKKVKALEGDIIEMDKPLADHKPVWALLELK